MTRRWLWGLLVFGGALVAMPIGQGLAAGGRGGGVGAMPLPSGLHTRHDVVRPARGSAFHHRRHGAGPYGYAPFLPAKEGFLSYPAGYMRGDEMPLTRRAPSPAPDPDSFEGMRVRVGIARAPTPDPTLYRLVGPRERPATRVVRLAQEQAGRHRHAETGALLLTVPRR